MNRDSKMIRRYFLLMMYLWTMTCLSCNEDSDPFEKINKLRAIGVATLPVVSSPSDNVLAPNKIKLTAYATVPLGGQVTIETFLDKDSKYALPIPVELVKDSEIYKDYNGFRLYQADLQMSVPSSETIIFPPDRGFLALRYGIILHSGFGDQKIVGNALIYPPGSPQLSWKVPTAQITAPASSSPDNKAEIALKAEVDSPNDGEGLRVGWYVSSGKLRNRRAKETIWEKADSGQQSIILTVRGLKSGALAPPKILDLTL